MERRLFLQGVVAGLLAAPLAAEAQQAGKVPRIGFLSGSSAVAARPYVEQFLLGLREADGVLPKGLLTARSLE